MRAIVAVAAVLLGGCAAQGLQGMSAEQIKAAGKDGTIICTQAFTPWGRATSTYFNVDRGVVSGGGFTVDKECAVTFHNAPAKPAP